jgi:hypothetical protein
MGKTFQMGAKMTLKDDFSNKKSVDSTTKSVGSYKDANGRLRDAQGKYITETKKAKKGSDDLKQSMGGLNGAAGLLKKAFIGLGLAAVFKKAKSYFVDANADMESYKNTLAVVLKSEDKAVKTLEWATTFAAKTPFEIPQIVEATTRMASYGINAQKTMGIVGDMASVMGKDLMSAVEAVADAQTGELERLKEFGITKKMIEDQAKAMKVTVTNNKGQITDQKAFNAVLFSLMEDRFKGGMEMQSKTFKGMVSNLKDFMGQTARELGAPVFDKVKEGLGKLLEWLNKLKDSGALASFMAKVQKVGGAIYGFLVNAIKYAIGRVKALAAAITSWYTANKPLIDRIGLALMNAFLKLKAFATPIIQWISSVGIPAIVSILGKVGTWVLKVANWFITNWSWIKDLVLGIAVAWGTYFAITKAIMIATKTWAAIQWVLNAAMNANPIGLIITAIGILIGVIILVVKNWDTVKAALVNGAKAVGNFFKSIFTGIKNFFVGVFNGIKSFIKKWGITILAIIGGPFTLVPFIVYKNWDKIKEFLGAGVEWIKGAFAKVGEFIGNVFNGLVDILKAPINFILRAINTMIGGVNSISIDIPDWVPLVGGKKFGFNIPEIPYLAKGTNNFQGGPAVINERGGEMAVMPHGSKVIPADKTDKILEAPKAGRVLKIDTLIGKLEIHQQPGEDAEALADKVIDKIYRKLKDAEEIAGSDDMGVLV